MAISGKFLNKEKTLALITIDGKPSTMAWPPANKAVYDWAFKEDNTPDDYDAIDPMKEVRKCRDSLIKKTSWMVERHRSQVDLFQFDPDEVVVELTGAQFTELLQYRQALRDVPQSQPNATIDTVVWPTKPSFL